VITKPTKPKINVFFITDLSVCVFSINSIAPQLINVNRVPYQII
jgi:hypothetical protein